MRRYGILIVAVLVAAVCGRLGFWQLARLDDRKTQNSAREARLALDRVQLDGEALLDSTHAFRRASARGSFDFVREVVVVGRSLRGVPGVYLVTPLRLPDGSGLLVERGWVPSPDGRSVDLPSYREPRDAMVHGILLHIPPDDWIATPTEATWPRYLRRADPEALAVLYPYPLHGVVLRRSVEPDAMPAGLRQIPGPELSSGPHLSYAIQWFAFGAIALIGSVTLVVRENRPPSY